MSIPEPLVYRVDEAAALLSVSDWTLREAIKHGEIPAIRIRGCILVPKAAIERMLAEAGTRSEANRD